MIIPQYEALWAQLAELRKSQAPSQPPLVHPWPARLDPFYAFAVYPTRQLTSAIRFRLADGDPKIAQGRLEGYRALKMVAFASVVMPDREECRALLERLAAGPQAAETLIAGLSPERRPYVLRGLAWLLKLGTVTTE